MKQTNDAAKFAFFYLLSLVSLLFMAISSGLVIFQLINKYIIDTVNQYSSSFNSDALKFSISAILVSTPIYYFTTRQILKNLFTGRMDEESGVRKWLTYFILLITAIVMIGWIIATVNSFLDGELTLKFVLKSITAIGIAAAIFSFYFYDIKREEVKGKVDKGIKMYFIISLAFVIAVFVTSIFLVESPKETRARKLDQNVINQLNNIANITNNYFDIQKKLPESLDILVNNKEYFLLEKDITNPGDNKRFEYKVISPMTFELCTNFLTTNIDEKSTAVDFYYPEFNLHKSGYQCLQRTLVPRPADAPVTPVMKIE